MPSNRLILSLSGPFRAHLEQGGNLDHMSLRGRALLAFLSQQPGMRAERGFVADLLWSDRADDQARASLRQELSVLRRTLPDGILNANRHTIWLDENRVHVDKSGPNELLQGFDLPSEGFEDWLRAFRATQDRETPSPPTPDAPQRMRPSLAVLPFDELSADEDDMFADGVVEEVTGTLSRVHEFHVIARQSAFALRSESIGVPEAAARLGADYVVEGTIRRAGERVRISVQLVRGSDSHTLWSERFDDRLDDLFDLQDRIAAQVAGQISPSLRDAEIERAKTTPPQDRSAYELTLTALPHFWASRRDTIDKAIGLLDAAIDRQPDFAPALAYKAWAVAHLPTYMWSKTPNKDHDRAVELALHAANHADAHAPTLVAIGAALAFSALDLELSEKFIDRALEIDPNNAWGWLRRGWCHVYAHRNEQALEALEKAEMLSPLDPFRFSAQVARGSALRQMGRADEGVECARRALRENPGATWIRRTLVLSLLSAGRTDEADKEMQILLGENPNMTRARFEASFPRAFWARNQAYAPFLDRFDF
ncbi:hypothetical protein RXV86_07925 [Alisedimentitalea sp. MJ-SS2]|uniref:hypothetical protein n=1 Tax=Aliisedimentitalea sp. MJ-SS2 TaxID=3049795 RepID=UPI0029083D13|nr:hypothetical protein [Alisedimentitalea sp. MJ-SS2]MDU8927309.1 hypothetical protein [Alisedimentitalea sp. MJ-SS2]